MKNILIILIVLSLSIPSYSAVSVADGSAFATKAEFESNLLKLSDRLSLLENSLDAKVDSLVSAYLNRNGIWNGAKQELVERYKKYKYGFTSGSDTNTGTPGTDQTYKPAYLLNLVTDKINLVKNNTYGKILTYGNLQGILVNNISKTGLAVAKTSCSNYTNYNGQAYIASSRADTPSLASDHFRFVFSATVEFYQESSNILGTSNVQFAAPQGGIYLIAPEIPSGYILMFVEKDKPLYVSYKSSIENDAGTNWANTLAFRDSKAYSYRNWTVDDMLIY